MRDWLTVIIVLLIIGIALDGWRRVRRARRESLRVSRQARRYDSEVYPTPPSSEFPAGGARVAARRDYSDAENVTRQARETYARSRVTVGAPNRIPEQVSLNLEQSVPMLMDSVEDAHNAERQVPDADGTNEPVGDDFDRPVEDDVRAMRVDGEESLSDEKIDEETDGRIVSEYEALGELNSGEATPPEDDPEDYSDAGSDDDRDWRSEEKTRWDNDSSAKPTDRHEPRLGDFDGLDDEQANRFAVADAPNEPEPGRDEQTEERAHKEPEEVLIINVMAPAGERFDGPSLLEALMDQNLRFGDMNIFHRHENDDGTGAVQFSLANMVVPGTFNLSDMAEFSTPGVSMFLSLPNESDSLAAFNRMADTARALSQQLGGEMKDENRSVMTRQTIEHCRQRVIEFERKQRLMNHA